MRRFLALFLLPALLLACAAPARAEEDCRPGEGIMACAGRLWRASTASWRDLYELPARGMEAYALRRLSAAPWELVLSREVAAVAQDPAGLAAATGDGRILAWTATGFCSARLPGNARPSRLAWAGGRHLAVLEDSRQRVFVLNLDTGAFARGVHDTGAAVSALSLSPSGLLLLADASGQVWTGPVLGPLRALARRAEPAVALGLSRDLGVMAASDAAGRVELTALRPVRSLDRVTVAGGPFTSGRVQDNVMVLDRSDGAAVGLDLATCQPVAAPAASRPADMGVALSGRTLAFQPAPDSPLARTWTLETVVERRFPAVWRSALGRCLRVEDFDKTLRYYRLGSGKPMEPVSAKDWERLAVDPAGRFTAEGEPYVLGDILFSERGLTLLARQAGDAGWYLWWVAGAAPAAARPGWLPKRVSLRADTDPDWVLMDANP
jgi:hypothetical protein